MSAHGTRSRYNADRCRCVECRTANTVYMRRRNAERYAYVAQYGLPPTVKHGLSAYNNWGCGCPICTQANTEASRRAYRARTKPT